MTAKNKILSPQHVHEVLREAERAGYLTLENSVFIPSSNGSGNGIEIKIQRITAQTVYTKVKTLCGNTHGNEVEVTIRRKRLALYMQIFGRLCAAW